MQGSAQGIIAAVNAFGARDDTHVSTITVAGNAVSTGGSATASIGAKAAQLAVVTINGNATGIDYGVHAYNYATITVGNHVTATGSGGPGSVGAYASNNSTVTIGGSLTGEIFAEVNGTRKGISEKTLPTTKSGYDTYAEGTSTIWLKDAGASTTDICKIGEQGFASLDLALEAVNPGETIKLLQTITHTSPVFIDDMDIIIDLSDGSLIINTWNDPDSYALTVRDCTVTTIGDGFLDVKGYDRGISAEGGTVTVRKAESRGNGAYVNNGGIVTILEIAKGTTAGAYAEHAGSKIIVKDAEVSNGINGVAVWAHNGAIIEAESALAQGVGSIGAAANNATIKISLDTSGVFRGVRAQNAGIITVGGNVQAGMDSGIGAEALSGGQITIDGKVTAESYVKVGVFPKTADNKTTPTTKSGYSTYHDSISSSTVWVKDAGASTSDVCKIDEQGFATLKAALDSVASGQAATIKLLQTIDYTSQITVNNKTVSFDLNGKSLNVVTNENYGLYVNNGGKVYLTDTGDGSGSLNVTGQYGGVGVTGAGSEAAVTNATGVRCGVDASGGTVMVYGNATATGKNNDDDWAVKAEMGSTVTVHGNATGHDFGVNAGRSTVTVYGDAIGEYGDNSAGVKAEYQGIVTVYGDAKGRRCGVSVADGCSVMIEGNAICTGHDYGTVYGVLLNTGTGPSSELSVTGNVSAVGANAYGAVAKGVWDGATAQITIGGSINAAKYIMLGEADIAADSGIDSIIKDGYKEYTDGRHTVWVKNGAPVQPTVTTSEATNVGTAGATLNGNVTADGGAAVTERGFVYAVASAPAIGGGGVTKVTAGAGTGTFTANISGLQADKTYHARAYAINGKGTSYGADITFKTAKAPTEIIAEAKEGSITRETLPVTVDSAAKTGTVRLAGDKAAQFLNNEKPITIAMPNIDGVNAYRLELPADVLRVGNKGKILTLSTSYGSLRVSGAMLAQLESAAGKTAAITLSQGEKTGLSDAEKTAIGNRPLVRLALTLDGAAANWEDFGAPVTVTIPYAASEAEKTDPGAIIVWYLDGAGAPVSIPNGRYDAATSTVAFVATHFSSYGVGYHPVAFRDVAKGDWYHKAVSFIAARNVALGTGGGKYSPAASLTRAQALVMLMRAYGLEPDVNPKDNFSDAGNAYYTKYLAAAKRLGIATGVGDNRFAPEQQASREEFFVFLYNLLKAIERLPDGAAGKNVSDFSDAGKTAGWAREAVEFLVKAGIVNGSGGKLSPAANMTRAEMAQVLYNLLSK